MTLFLWTSGPDHSVQQHFIHPFCIVSLWFDLSLLPHLKLAELVRFWGIIVVLDPLHVGNVLYFKVAGVYQASTAVSHAVLRSAHIPEPHKRAHVLPFHPGAAESLRSGSTTVESPGLSFLFPRIAFVFI